MHKNIFILFFTLFFGLTSTQAYAQSADEILDSVADKSEEVISELGNLISGRRRPRPQPAPREPRTTTWQPNPRPQIPTESFEDRQNRLALEETQRQKLAEEQRLRSEALAQTRAEKEILSTANFKEAINDEEASQVRRLLQNISASDNCKFPITFATINTSGVVFSFDQIISESYPFNSEQGGLCARSFLLFYLQHKLAKPDPRLSSLCQQSSCPEIKKAYQLFTENSEKLLALISGESFSSTLEHGAPLLEIHRLTPGSSQKYPEEALTLLKAEMEQVRLLQQGPDQSLLWGLQQRSRILNDLIDQAEREQGIEQLTTREELSENSSLGYSKERSTSTSFDLVKPACEEYRSRLKASSVMSLPVADRSLAMFELRPFFRMCSISANREGSNVTSILFKNDTPNAINPSGNEQASGSSREYKFEFPGRSKRHIALRITDNAGLAAGMSANLLETTIVFLPRKVIPYFEVDNNDPIHRKLFLPTGETVTFDAVTQEIKDGVLEESTIDVSENRHTRKFATLRYSGNGITIRVDRRAGTPEHIYSVAFNSHERIREATITHKGKVCYVSKSLIWQNAENADLDPVFKYATDRSF